MIKPLIHFVMVKVDKPEEKSQGGIIIVDQTRQAEMRAAELGTVIGIGETAWMDGALGGHVPINVGDKVFFAKYAGKWVKEPDSEEEFLMLNDQDIVGVIIDE